MRRVFEEAVSAIFIIISYFVGGPLALIGVMRLSKDMPREATAFYGVQLIGMAFLTWSVALAWRAWLHCEPDKWQFSLRTLLIAMTLAALVLGLVVWASR